MKLDYAYTDLANLFDHHSPEQDLTVIRSVAFDSRRISNGDGVLFFALEGVFRDGHNFIQDAYEKGVRYFIVSKPGYTENLTDAKEIVVENTYSSLQALAKHHRNCFSCPVVAITGSNGKTTVKEWLSHLLGEQFNVARSPKSYNSRLGVAVSLLELTENTDVAIIEVGVPGKGEMRQLKEMIQPTHGILTSFGSAHREVFDTAEEHLNEKLILFEEVDHFLYPESIQGLMISTGRFVPNSRHEDLLKELSFTDSMSRQNARLAVSMALELGIDSKQLPESIRELNALALRLESYDGIHGNTIINDTYNLDNDSLRLSLGYQLANANDKKRIVIVGLSEKNEARENEIREIIESFDPSEFHFHYPDEQFEYSYQNSCILIKGTRAAKMEQIARNFKQQNHQTFLEIDLTAVRHNINFHKSKLKEDTKLLCMVKASSYGSDARTMGKFLEGMGVDYLGVAYVDEGVELRKSGIKAPILVMNCEESAFAQCIEYSLEPAIFSLQQLNTFIVELINQSRDHYPIHIKLETGMNRLGFAKEKLPALIDLIKGQPEIYIKSIYSHLAESDIENSEFTRGQIDTFNILADQLDNEFAYSIMRHILNSTGVQNYPSAQLDMVRLGIGMYGASTDEHLRPAVSWYSSISQIKKVEKGESVGYSRSFFAETPMEIAIVPVGYADGFRRSLGQGNGGVYIKGNYCKTVGNVCMDMIMVDVTGLQVNEGDSVELIGEHHSIVAFAKALDTIPYEVMTSFSKRVHRVFLDK